ncbi:MAG: sigma-70 family RNA polymerase sigma factor [Myxococcota bacterium]
MGRAESSPSDKARPVKLADNSDFAAVVRREAGRLLATARRFTDSEADAQDCVQEAFLHAYRARAQFEGRAKVSSWLHRILVNVALERARKKSRRPEESLDDLQPTFDERGCRIEPRRPPPPEAQTLLERSETRRAVLEAIGSLPDSYRRIVILRDIEGKTTAETAEELGLTENASKVRLHRARAALKRLLEPEMGLGRKGARDR